MIASREVRATDTHLEEAVAGEQRVLQLAVETDAAGGMAGGGEYAELMVPEWDDGVWENGLAGRARGAPHSMAQDIAHLFLGVLEERQVALGTTGCQPVAFVQEGSTPEVVEMGVREQMCHRAELLGVDVVREGCFLLVVEGSAVDDDGILGLVAENVAVGA